MLKLKELREKIDIELGITYSVTTILGAESPLSPTVKNNNALKIHN